MYRFTICLLIVSWLVALSAEAKFSHEHHVCTLANGLARTVQRIFGPPEEFPRPGRLKELAEQLQELTRDCPGLKEGNEPPRKKYVQPGDDELDLRESKAVL